MRGERGGDYNDKAEGWKMRVGVEAQVTKKRSGGIGDGRALGYCRRGLNSGQGILPSADSQPG